jgi:Spy/CpxP family protein refolding chaperone
MKLLMPMILTAVLCLPTLSMAKPKDGKGGGFEKALKQLELSDAQKKQLKEMRAAHKENKFSQGKELKKLREQMKTQFVSDAPEAELKAIHTKIKSLRDLKAETRFSKLLAIRKILTVEQRKKFQELQMKPKKAKRRNQ